MPVIVLGRKRFCVCEVELGAFSIRWLDFDSGLDTYSFLSGVYYIGIIAKTSILEIC